jgi:hypothetical protein
MITAYINAGFTRIPADYSVPEISVNPAFWG